VETWTPFPLADVDAALEAAEQHHGAAKVLITMESFRKRAAAS